MLSKNCTLRASLACIPVWLERDLVSLLFNNSRTDGISVCTDWWRTLTCPAGAAGQAARECGGLGGDRLYWNSRDLGQVNWIGCWVEFSRLHWHERPLTSLTGPSSEPAPSCYLKWSWSMMTLTTPASIRRVCNCVVYNTSTKFDYFYPKIPRKFVIISIIIFTCYF